MTLLKHEIQAIQDLAANPNIPTSTLRETVDAWDDQFIDLMAERERTPKWRWLKRMALESQAQSYNSAALHLALELVGREDQ